MAWMLETNWRPTRLTEVGRRIGTNTGPVRVMTDAGPGYLKAMGNPEGSHVLATDWVGTHLAGWFGLPTFDLAIVRIGADETFPLGKGGTALPGPAFVAREMTGGSWDRSAEQLDLLVNPEDITRLVVFDTWTLNCDRHEGQPLGRKPKYDNVFLASDGVDAGKRRLIAMDHGLCFIRSGQDLTPKLANIDKVQDEHVYGLFPEFRGRLQDAIITSCVTRLREMDAATAKAMIDTVPTEWEVSDSARVAWADLISRRAAYVADNVRQRIELAAPWFRAQGE